MIVAIVQIHYGERKFLEWHRVGIGTKVPNLDAMKQQRGCGCRSSKPERLRKETIGLR
jgi:hypothetical protein